MLFFGLQLPDTIVYKRSEAFVDFNFTFLFIHVEETSEVLIRSEVVGVAKVANN